MMDSPIAAILPMAMAFGVPLVGYLVFRVLAWLVTGTIYWVVAGLIAVFAPIFVFQLAGVVVMTPLTAAFGVLMSTVLAAMAWLAQRRRRR